MTPEQYRNRCRALQDQYDVVNLTEKVCNERVDYLVDLCNVKTDYIAQLEEPLEHKHIHVTKHPPGDWSFGICLTHDNYLNETYIYINFFKWSISIGKLGYLKEIEEEI